MFGYIKPLVSELKVGEYEYYRGVYCGLCRSLGHNTGQGSRFSLNYDLVFLALLRMAVLEEQYSFKRRRCFAHPLNKKAVLNECRALSFCAYATAMFTGQKVRDNIADSHGIKKLGAAAMMPYGKMLSRRSRKIRELTEKVEERLSELSRLESEKCPSVDQPADAFGYALAIICSGDLGEEDSVGYRICYDAGYHLGRFIYIADAADDISRDVKEGNYNPIRYSYDTSELTEQLKKNLYEALLLECQALCATVSLLDFSQVPLAGNIIKNIIELGMPAAAARILGVTATGETV